MPRPGPVFRHENMRKMISSHKLLLLSLVLLFSLMWGCIGEDDHPQECRQGLSIALYSKTRCETERGYPEEIDRLHLFLFDQNGVLADRREVAGVTLSADYRLVMETGKGLYTAVAWAGLDTAWVDLVDPVIGSTRKDELLFRLHRSAGVAADLSGRRVYMGESSAVYVEEKSRDSEYVPLEINLLEVTNRLTVSVEGLPEAPGRYEIAVLSDNGSMNYDGTIAEDRTLESPPEVVSQVEVLESVFTLLKLETGHENTLVVRDLDTDTELYRGSLLGALLLKNPEVDLNCDHDFSIRFTAEDQCDCGTYAITEIRVNNWLVHSYGAEM